MPKKEQSAIPIEPDKRKKVHIAIPIEPDERSVDAEVLGSVLKMTNNPEGHKVSLGIVTLSPIDNARSHLVNKFLETDGDYLLFIDNDNPPRGNPLELVKEDFDIFVCPTLLWSSEIHKRGMGKNPLVWNVFNYVEALDKWGSLERIKAGSFEIDAGGTGCMLIARRVLEAVRPAFHRSWNEDGTVDQGSDLLFCKQAKGKGFKVWTNFAYQCGHLKRLDLLEVYKVLGSRDIVHANRPNPNTIDYWNRQWGVREERPLEVYEPIVEWVKSKRDAYNKAARGDERAFRVLDYGCGRGDLLAQLSALEGVQAIGQDHAHVAVEVCEGRGLEAECCDSPEGLFDAIVCTQVLEHVDEDEALVEELLEHAPSLAYSVPWNCLPPGLEPEHMRVYNKDYVRLITPFLTEIKSIGDYLIAIAEREEVSS